MQLRTTHIASLHPANSHAATTNAVPHDASAAGWVPLGPKPLASDSSGSGVQDYGWVAGRVNAIAVDPADGTGNTVYIGGAYGGVWKSSNAGAVSTNPSSVTSTAVTDNQATLVIDSIAIQPQLTSPDAARSVVLAGTGETNNFGDSYYGLGILRSADGGNAWTLISHDLSATRSFATAHSTAVGLILSFNFALNNNSDTQTITAGQTAAFNLDAVPLGNPGIFPGNVTLSCASSGMPVLSTCSFTPTQVPSGSGDTNVRLNVVTSGATGVTARFAGPRHDRSYGWSWYSLFCYSIGFSAVGIVLAFGR